MALWQFEIGLVPRKSSKSPAPDNSQEDNWWGEVDIKKNDLQRVIGKHLNIAESWNPQVLIWGEESGNRITAVIEGESCVELTARIDVRSSYSEFVDVLVSIARGLGCICLDQSGRLFEPDAASLIDEAKKSMAARFVQDPEKFFSD